MCRIQETPLPSCFLVGNDIPEKASPHFGSNVADAPDSELPGDCRVGIVVINLVSCIEVCSERVTGSNRASTRVLTAHQKHLKRVHARSYEVPSLPSIQVRSTRKAQHRITGCSNWRSLLSSVNKSRNQTSTTRQNQKATGGRCVNASVCVVVQQNLVSEGLVP